MTSAADLLNQTFTTKAQASTQTPAWLRATAEAERDSIPDGSLVEQQARFYQKLSWVSIAVTAVAQTAAGTPFGVKQRAGEDLKDIPNHEFELRLQRPNPLQSRFEFLEATFAYRRLTGNAYWWLNRLNEKAVPDELWIIPPHKIVPVPDQQLFIRGYLYDAGIGDPIPLEPWEIAHFKRFHPLNSFVGLSPLEALAIAAHGDLKMQAWNTNFFAKDNAKIPGALAFADPISDADWEKMKADVNRQHGGTQRRMMMLRNVGKGGVEWIAMAMSQKDMEFLNARQFTKEEIFATFAPGLASVLAINATEANSTAGKATFYEMSIWPEHVAVAEKVSNNVLPAYGEDLVGTFDDVRIKDRALELQERTAYERTHTIDEVRKKYDGDEPLGDERGTLLIAEVGKGLTAAAPPAPEGMAAGAGGEADALPSASSTLLLGDMGADTPALDVAEADLAKWERKALKRLKSGKRAACAFASDVLDDEEAQAIEAALQHATTERAVKAAFVAGADLSDDERVLYERLRGALETQANAVARAIRSDQASDISTLSGEIRAALTTAITTAVNEHLVDLASAVGPHFETAMVAQDIAAQYVATYLNGIDATTRQAIERATIAYRATPTMTHVDLVAALRGSLGPRRAEQIAITALSEAASQATNRYQALLKEAGVTMERIWQTAADDRTCPICGPLNGRSESEWAGRFPSGPPAHQRCRCGMTLRTVKR